MKPKQVIKGVVYDEEGKLYEPIVKIRRHFALPPPDPIPESDSDSDDDDPRPPPEPPETWSILLISSSELAIFQKAVVQYYAHKIRSRKASKKKRRAANPGKKPQKIVTIHDVFARAHLMYSEIPEEHVTTIARNSRKAPEDQLFRFFSNYSTKKTNK